MGVPHNLRDTVGKGIFWMVAYYNEIERYCCDWLSNLMDAGEIPAGRIDDRDLWDVEPLDLMGYDQVHLCAGLGGWPAALRRAGWANERPIWTVSCPCFPAGTLIFTIHGQVPIEQIKVGDLVLTHEGRYRPVLRTGSQIGRVVTVKGQGHPGLETTAEHPFWARSASIDYRRGSPTYQRRRFEAPEWVHAAELKGKFWANITRVPEDRIPAFPVREGRAYKSNMPTGTDAGLMRFLGYWVGDGWTSQHSKNPGYITICGGHKDAELLAKLANGAGLTGSHSKGPTGTKFRVGSQIFAAWIDEHFGHGAAGKRIPAWIHGLSLELRYAFMDGLLLADGHRETQKRGGGKVRCLTTVSKALAIGFRILANQTGFSASITRKFPKRFAQIEGRYVSEQGFYRVVVYEKSRSMHFDGDFAWGNVRSVNSLARECRVFNLEVADDNTYVAEGIVVHNCQPFSQAGARAGFTDERHLWPAVFWHISQCQPDRLIGEQVSSRDGLVWLDLVCSDLENAGYACGATVFPSAGVGAPNIRHRIWWCADRLAVANQGQRGRLPDGQGSVEHRTPSGRQQGNGIAQSGGSNGGLADSGGVGREQRAGSGEQQVSARERRGEPDDGGGTGGVGDPSETRRSGGQNARADCGDEGADGSGRVQPERASAHGGLEPAEGRGRRKHRHVGETIGGGQNAGQSAQPDVDAGGGLRHAGGAGLAHAEPPALRNAGSWIEERRAAEQSAGARHPWRELEWIVCLDGRQRPTEPALFELAPGLSADLGYTRAEAVWPNNQEKMILSPLRLRVPGDVQKLRAFGNAINVEAASAVITAWMGHLAE